MRWGRHMRPGAGVRQMLLMLLMPPMRLVRLLPLMLLTFKSACM